MGGRGRGGNQTWQSGLMQAPGASAQLNLSPRIERDRQLAANMATASRYLKADEVPAKLRINYTDDPNIYGERVGRTLFINRNAIRYGHPLFTAAIVYHEGTHYARDPRMTRYGSSIRMENRVRTQTRKWARRKLLSGQASPDEVKILRRIIGEQQPYVRK